MNPSEYPLGEPIAAIATALAPAALGVIRVSGNDSVRLLSACFSRGEALRAAPGNTLVHGWILGENGTADRIDEVMVAAYRSPKSFTGEEAAEITCHGGTATVLAVYRRLLAAGFREAERGEFAFRAFANGKTDLLRAEAIREIIGAQTETALSHAANRLAGDLSAEIRRVKESIIRARAAIGVEIEYPEEEDAESGAFDDSLVREALQALARLRDTWAAERLLQDGARVVLAGRTNAGKSSFFNTLLKEDRAIVSDVPGTTRDWLESTADFSGIPVRLFDTAGMRETGDAIEAEGVNRSRLLASEADLILYLVDSSEGLDAGDRAFLSDAARDGTPAVLVWNKDDRSDSKPLPSPLPTGARAAVRTSAKRGTGVSELVRQAAGILLEGTGGGPSGKAGQAVRAPALGSERQKRDVAAACESLEHAVSAAAAGFPMDAIEEDLSNALDHLASITGEVSGADVLDAVFSGFCVGK